MKPLVEAKGDAAEGNKAGIGKRDDEGGDVGRNALGDQVAEGQDEDDAQRQKLVDGEGGGRWPHDQQHADEARENGGGAPQAHFLLQKDHRHQHHRQRHALQNGGEIGNRHVHAAR